MASRFLGETLINLGQQIPQMTRLNRRDALEAEELRRRNRMDDERFKWAQSDAERKLDEDRRAKEAQAAVDEAIRLMSQPQQEPVLPEMPSETPPLGEGIDVRGSSMLPGHGFSENEINQTGIRFGQKPPPLSVGGDVSQLTSKYLPKKQMLPYKAPLGPKEAAVEANLPRYGADPNVKEFMDNFGTDKDKNGYGKSSVGAKLAFTEAHPELVAEGMERLKALRSTYGENYLDGMETYLRTDVVGALKDLMSVQGRTEEKVRSLYETMPGEVEKAGRKAGAAGEAGTRARIKTEYETKTGIPGSFKASQYAAGNYAHRIEQSESVLSDLNKSGFDPGSFYNMIKSADAVNAIKDPEQRKYAQAMRNFINATLRRESGAAIAESEFTNANKQYFAQLNDDAETLSQKAETRARVLDAFKAEAGGAYDQIVQQSKSRDKDTSDKFQVGKIYRDGKGNRAKYLGNGQWEEL